MRLNREGRRTVAQFLNGVAVAMLVTMILAPLAGGKVDVGMATLGGACALSLHAVALFLAVRQ